MTSGIIYLPKWCGRGLLVFCLFIVLGAGVYGNSLHNQFHYDDTVYVVNNANIREIKNIPRFFVEPRLSASKPQLSGHYRPLVVMSYAINYAIGGLNPAGYHLVNLAFHAGTAFLLFLIVKAMLESRLIGRRQKLEARSKKQEARKEERNWGVEFFAALAAGLIFLVHPFNSEAVNYITARSSLMSGFFYLLGFYFWVKYREQSAVSSKQLSVTAHSSLFTAYYYIGSILAFMAGMLSKEVVITLPVVCFLYDLYFYCPRQSAGSSEQSAVSSKQIAGKSAHSSPLTANYLLSWRTYIPYLSFVLMVVIPYLVIRASSFGGGLPHFQRDIWTQLLTEFPVLVRHWQMFLIPGGLSLTHDVTIYRDIARPVLFSGLLLVLYTGVAVYLIRLGQAQWRVVSFFMFWFFIVLLPTTLFPLNAIFQENRGYLAIVSFAVVGGSILWGWRGKKLWPFKLIVVVLLVVYAAITVQRNWVWGDDVRLWKDAVEKSPAYGTAYAGLSGAYVDRGDTFLALEVAKKGVLIEPDNYFIRSNLGRIYRLMGDPDKAIQEFEKALELNPRKAIIWNDLGLLYVRKGDMERAELCLTKASELWGDMPNIYYNLGIIRLGRGKISEAEGALRRAVSLNPTYLRARYELGEVLERLGRFDEAREQYREIISIGSDRSDISDIWSSALEEGKRELGDKIVEKARQRLKEGDKS